MILVSDSDYEDISTTKNFRLTVAIKIAGNHTKECTNHILKEKRPREAWRQDLIKHLYKVPVFSPRNIKAQWGVWFGWKLDHINHSGYHIKGKVLKAWGGGWGGYAKEAWGE